MHLQKLIECSLLEMRLAFDTWYILIIFEST